ncbi:MAG: hypothetical protein GY881_02900 [Gammaproteobacteria bacterium]|nr:hypothetical protein [Gammaproteobacteria bacterium]
MNSEQFKIQLATDASFALQLVVINNPAAVTNALMADNLIFGNAPETALHSTLVELYEAGQYGKLQNILSQVEYINGELPDGYDQVLVGAPDGRMMLVSGEGNEQQGSGIDWTSVINSAIDSIGSNLGSWINTDPNELPPGTQPPVAPVVGAGTDYTPYIIGGGALVLLLIILVIVMKK